MLNIMWTADSKEQLQDWMSTLSLNDQKVAASLLIMLKHEILEELIDDEMIEAKEVLNKFTSME